MIERVERLPRPEPDIENLLAVLRRQKPRRVPMVELKIDEEICAALLGEPIAPWSKNAPADARRKFVEQTVSVPLRLGLDAFRLRTGIPFDTIKDATADTAGLSRGQRGWQNEHAGPIQSRDDLERYRWPTVKDVDFGPVEEIFKAMPAGMAPIAYISGVFEWASWLMGLETFMIALYDMPDVVRAVVDRVGQLIYECFEVWCRDARIPIVWLGDDLGFKTAPLIGPEVLREYILPWHARFADLAHRHGKLFMLHCCGNIDAIMPDMADTVRIDAKHSFEDVIEPVEQFYDKWHRKVAVIGGVDIDILARFGEQEVARRTRQILEHCAPQGGYAAGSGNSVTNYIPVNNYLAMIETVHRFNGRM